MFDTDNNYLLLYNIGFTVYLSSLPQIIHDAMPLKIFIGKKKWYIMNI